MKAVVQAVAAAVLVALPMAVAVAARAESFSVAYIHDVAVPMRDGVKLHADIYRPDSAGKFPVLLQRTPYNKNDAVDFGLKAAAQGYVVVIQDVRGRYASEGEWYPFRNEANDGYDTIEWAAALPYSNGKVGMFGGSYVGATQVLAAIAHPPHLAGICPVVTANNYHENWTYQGGAFEQWFNESWTSGLAQDTQDRAVRQTTHALTGVPKLPLTDYPLIAVQSLLQSELTAKYAPYFLDWLNHPDYDDYWKALAIDARYADIKVPALHIAAWYDIFLDGSLHNYLGIKAHGGTEQARRNQRLLVAVGGHAGWFGDRKIGAVDFGPNAPIDEDAVTLRWYDWLLKGIDNGVEREAPVRLFVMGKNEWRNENEWPLGRTRYTRYYLHAINAAANDTLNPARPQQEKPDQLVYDPRDPVPTLGGSLCCEALPSGIGPQDQRPAESRPDVLNYTTPVFAKDTEVTGPVSLDLYVSSSAVDTDFTAMLVDIWPNGFAQNLTSGILRLRYRNSMEHPEPMTPGEKYRVTLNLGATSNVFLAGHKLRLEVSSSNFPRFDRNLNNGADQAHSTAMVTATNVVYHDKAHPSALIIPIIP